MVLSYWKQHVLQQQPSKLGLHFKWDLLVVANTNADADAISFRLSIGLRALLCWMVLPYREQHVLQQ